MLCVEAHVVSDVLWRVLDSFFDFKSGKTYLTVYKWKYLKECSSCKFLSQKSRTMKSAFLSLYYQQTDLNICFSRRVAVKFWLVNVACLTSEIIYNDAYG
jgi:hypothetical protein